MSPQPFIFDAIRTPRGRGRAAGALHPVKPVSLISGLIVELLRRNASVDPHQIDDVVLGVVSPLGEQGGDIARTAALVAGLPETAAGLQVNRFCGSGLEAVNIAAQKVASGWEHLVLAGGVESMSRVPMGSDGGALTDDPETMHRLGFVPQGVGADLIATVEGFTRSDVDAYAARSHERAAHAWDHGYFERSVVPVRDLNGVGLLERDEHLRPGSTVESLAALSPSFADLGAIGFDDVAIQKYHWIDKIDHVHTAANSSGIVDGAALVLLGSEDAGREFGLRPRGRVVATAVSGSDPTIMLTGPTPATRKVLKRAGLRPEDVDLFELNEAFASVVLKYQKDLGIPDDRINVNGGAIAMGHPLGATGAMILGTALDELERRDLHRAVVTLCIGAGMGIATLIERV
ncbi:acetyl-CoA C-acetyltransferase [Georgenia sp. SYP-B2076]|uniref:acetyl-CoA C-acetyltransferase n=1 Tax=Georgenia sp. SYP-B2076 TaxID=2495881 RepID=UPI000F8F5565|nr:acetyl-CoA C-acetyltransferase [Georgenia sp. SYP-B2076]